MIKLFFSYFNESKLRNYANLTNQIKKKLEIEHLQLQFEHTELKKGVFKLQKNNKCLEMKIFENNKKLKQVEIINYWIKRCKFLLNTAKNEMLKFNEMKINEIIEKFSFLHWQTFLETECSDLFKFVNQLILSFYKNHSKGTNIKKKNAFIYRRERKTILGRIEKRSLVFLEVYIRCKCKCKYKTNKCNNKMQNQIQNQRRRRRVRLHG